TCTEAGESSFTCTLCGVSKTEPVAALGHNFVDRICTVCGLEKPVLAFYMVGYINGADYGTEGDFENMGEYKFVDGTLKATFTADSYVFIKTEGNANWYMAEAYCQDTTCTFVEGGSEKMFVPGNQALVFTLVENADGSLTLSYAVDPDGCAHEWDEGVETAAPSCTEAGEITYTCGLCGDTKTESVDALGHDYTDGVCGTCGEAEPVVDYYLVGYINGADYGCNDDYENLGEYKFIDGTLVATFDIDSYVFIKTGDNAKWFLTEAYCTDIIGIFVEGGSEKMFVPGGVEITFSLSENPDGSLTMSYSTAEPGVGATVSGTITSFLTDDDVTIELIQDGVVAYSVVASGKSAAYSIVGVADGAYTMKISKANHVALEVEVVISGEDAVFDASIYPLGDANGDGKVNMKDWARMYEHINEVNALTGYAFTSADVNNDGKVNMKDWARLYEHVNEINPLW
ncbi:MAG: dockerin type I repeat-containing protein, partial [Oscillospiraceae bacterium]|nr:dockerin type I repeat-containing protein [Oscillospiraceae bacterium]